MPHNYGQFVARVRLFAIAWIALCLLGSAIAGILKGNADLSQELAITGIVFLPLGIFLYYLCDCVLFRRTQDRAALKIILSAALIIGVFAALPPLLAAFLPSHRLP